MSEKIPYYQTITPHFYEGKQFGEDMFTFFHLYASMVRAFPNGSHFVEVGSWKGRSAACMAVEILNSKKSIKFDCVDIWGVSPNQGEDSMFGDELFNCFKTNIEPVQHLINPIRKDSIAASADYEDESLDFVMLDADTSYYGVYNNLRAWFPKIKKDGVLACHDYAWFDTVRNACYDFFGKGHYQDPWYNGCFMLRKYKHYFNKRGE